MAGSTSSWSCADAGEVVSAVRYGSRLHGHPARAAANPHEGRNALDAMILFFNSIGPLRQQTRDDARPHGAITNGGSAPNVIPAHTKARFRVRAKDRAYADELKQRVIACAQGAAAATATRMEWHEYARPYLNMRPNAALATAFGANLAAIGRTLTPQSELRGGMGSTDLGSVS